VIGYMVALESVQHEINRKKVRRVTSGYFGSAIYLTTSRRGTLRAGQRIREHETKRRDAGEVGSASQEKTGGLISSVRLGR
jgi:hypothetical protein